LPDGLSSHEWSADLVHAGLSNRADEEEIWALEGKPNGAIAVGGDAIGLALGGEVITHCLLNTYSSFSAWLRGVLRWALPSR